MNTPTQTWPREDGTFGSRRKSERNREIARLVWVEGVSTVDVALRFAISGPRVSQIIWAKEFEGMRKEFFA